MSDLLGGGEKQIAEPLSTETAKSRRTLIAVTALWATLLYLDLTPTKISFLGIDLQDSKIPVTRMIGYIALYFWISFLVYGFRDWAGWATHIVGGWTARRQAIQNRDIADQAAEDALRKAIADGRPRNENFRLMWPQNNHEQDTSIEQLEKHAPTWREHAVRLRGELSFFAIDFSVRTVWEFFLPFGCGMAVLGWLILEQFS